MTIKSWNLVLVVALLAVLSGGGYVLYQNHLHKQEEIRIAQEKARVEAEQKRAASLKAVEDFFNQFLAQIADGANDYKQARIVLTNLVHPMNMTTPEYIATNAEVAQDTLAALKTQQEKIMGLFQSADAQFEAVAAGLAPEDQPALREKWASERQAQEALFKGYFASEQDVLGAYEALIRFYADKKDTMIVDGTNKIISFSSPDDQIRETELKQMIVDLNAQQAALLNPEKAAEPEASVSEPAPAENAPAVTVAPAEKMGPQAPSSPE